MLFSIGDGQRIRRPPGLFLEQLVDALIFREICVRAVPSDENLLALRFGQQRQLGDFCFRIRGHTFEQRFKVAEHPADADVIKTRAVVKNFNQHRIAAVGVHDERIVRLAANAELAVRPLAALCAQRIVPRRVLKIENALEQRLAGRHFAPALDFHERRVLEPA